jgi:hypothetical protein
VLFWCLLQIFKKVCSGVPPQGVDKISDAELREFVKLCITHDPAQVASWGVTAAVGQNTAGASWPCFLQCHLQCAVAAVWITHPGCQRLMLTLMCIQPCASQRPEARQLLKHPFFECIHSISSNNNLHGMASKRRCKLALETCKICSTGFTTGLSWRQHTPILLHTCSARQAGGNTAQTLRLPRFASQLAYTATSLSLSLPVQPPHLARPPCRSPSALCPTAAPLLLPVAQGQAWVQHQAVAVMLVQVALWSGQPQASSPAVGRGQRHLQAVPVRPGRAVQGAPSCLPCSARRGHQSPTAQPRGCFLVVMVVVMVVLATQEAKGMQMVRSCRVQPQSAAWPAQVSAGC